MSACWRFPDEASIEVWAYQPSLHDFRFLCLSTIKEGIDRKPLYQAASGKAHDLNGGAPLAQSLKILVTPPIQSQCSLDRHARGRV